MIETCSEEFPFAVQIFGSEPPILREAAQFLEARGVHSVDINMGCPVERITKNGSGASLMCRPADTVELVRHVVEGVDVPVTVKMRLGWDSSQITAPKFAAEFEQVGVAAIAIHGRTRAQGFSGQVDREGIRRVVEAVSRIPVVGNGDICTIADAARMFEETGCAAISIGRGALANPWISGSSSNGKRPDATIRPATSWSGSNCSSTNSTTWRSSAARARQSRCFAERPTGT